MKRKELLYISITIFLTIVAWFLIEIYKLDLSVQLEKKEIVLNRKISIDINIIKKLKERVDDIQ